MSTQYPTPDPAPDMPTRSVSVPHLVTGLVFLGLAGAWLLGEAGVIGSVPVEWLLPVILVVAGAAGLVASLARGVSRGRAAPEVPTDAG